MKYAPYVENIYFDGDCDICGTEFCILKDRDTNVPFYYCYSCGSSYQTLPEAQNELVGYVVYAPNGIDVVSTEDIKKLELSFRYVEPYDEHHESMLSDAWIYTELKIGNFEHAEAICNHIISTWHQPSEKIKSIRQALSTGVRDFNVIWKNV
jgi:hypothetical protein